MKILFSLLPLALYVFSGFAIADAAQARRRAAPMQRSAGPGGGTEDRAMTPAEAEDKGREFEKSSQWLKASVAYRRAANFARRNGEYQRAIQNGQKALEMGKATENPLPQVAALLQLSYAYRQIRERGKAQEALEQAMELAKKIPGDLRKTMVEANIYRELGLVFLQRGDTDKAIEYITYALQRQESQSSFLKRRGRTDSPGFVKNLHNMAQSLQRLGMAYSNRGKTAEAIEAYEKSLRILDEYQLRSGTQEIVYGQLGLLYSQRKDFPRAMENARKALDLAEQRQHANVIWHSSKLLGDLTRQTEGPARAVPYYERAITVIEASRAELESEEFRTSFFEGAGPVYTGMIIAQIAGNHWAEGFDYNERARSRAFLDVLGSKVQLGAGDLLEEERALQERISGLRARLSSLDQTDEDTEAPRENPEQIKESLAAARKAYNEYLAKVRNASKEQASLMNVEPLTLQQVQEQLAAGETLLEYYVARGQIVLWIVEKDQLHGVVLPAPRRELIGKINALRSRISQAAQPADLKARSQDLYRLLIEPALPFIKGSELIIVPHDALHYLPFQALISPKGNYLVEDYPIRYLSSASLMQFTKEKKRASRETTLGLGNPSLGDPAFNLRFAEREVRELARIYSKSDIFLRDQATRSNAVALGPTHDILHFAVHAEFNEEDPMSSALLLARKGNDDGRLKVGDIFSLNLKADLVVLSACETGLGKISSGDEIVGLTRAFIYAGTPSVITTLWKVNDRASYELMTDFYSNLKTMKKAEALRQAQLKTMKEFPQPFFWAAYELTGEP